jgi:farnesyl-diphosphate farnesyltransferase
MSQDPGDWMQRQADRTYQDSALAGVSRSFAFTIPELPDALRPSVTNAYLLCRIADSIEDHGELDLAAKRHAYAQLLEALEGAAEAERVAAQLLEGLSPATPVAERELVRNLPRVLRVAAALPEAHRRATTRCVRILCAGMSRFEEAKSPAGLATMAQFDEYCYHVAGVVGELLTALFCEHVPAMAQQRRRLMGLAVCFGQGLQMTNILSDIWEDRARGICWLPREVFLRHGCALEPGADWAADPAFRRGLLELIAVAHGHLQLALEYTLQVPPDQTGIRRFCSWAIGMALLTLRRIFHHRSFTAREQIKITRREAARVIAVGNFGAQRDWALRGGFRLAGRGLPLLQAHAPAASSSLPL